MRLTSPPPQVLLLDEISTGLDSSTTYQIIKYLRDTTHYLQYTTLIALLQPAPETYDLFDDVLRISGGVHWKPAPLFDSPSGQPLPNVRSHPTTKSVPAPDMLGLRALL